MTGVYYPGQAYPGQSDASTATHKPSTARSFGVKVSQRGYDVKEAKDYQLAYSSSWPLLNIVATGSFSAATPGSTLVSHLLNYEPMFLVYTNNALRVGAANRAYMLDGFNANAFGISDTNLQYSSGASGNVTGRYFVFHRELGKNYIAPNVNPGTDAQVTDSNDKDFGIKISKDGADISSTDLRDFGVHSKTRSPMVHSMTSGTKSAGSTPIVVKHDIGYAPAPLVYIKLLSGSLFSPARYQMATSAEDSHISSSDTDASVYIPYACEYSIVLLKDPLTEA